MFNSLRKLSFSLLGLGKAFFLFSFVVLVVFLIRNLAEVHKSSLMTNLPSKPAAGQVLQARISPIIVDHTSVDLFEQIPDEYITAARELKQMFIDQSVGANISEGLTCLSYPSVSQAPSACKRPNATTSGLVADSKYSRDNWDYFHWGSLNLSNDYADWPGVGYAFIEAVTPRLSQYQVFSYQYSYLHMDDQDGIHLIPGGFFSDNPPNSRHPKADIYDMEQFFSQHPDKIFILWTSSLARIIGSRASYEFNNQMREYARSNNKILFDVADIESHAPDGRECTYNGYPAICPEYTSEQSGGHLGSMSTGKIRIAKAMWVLMAQIAGWVPDGSGSGNSNPTPQPSEPTPAATVAPTLTPSPTPGNVVGYIHVGDIDPSVKYVTGGWQGRFVVYVHNDSHLPVSGVTVSGSFYGAWNGSRTCVTNNSGWCALTSDRISDSTTVGMSITNLSLDGYQYDFSSNHDPDGDSNGFNASVSN